jgi:hypothetical protein
MLLKKSAILFSIFTIACSAKAMLDHEVDYSHATSEVMESIVHQSVIGNERQIAARTALIIQKKNEINKAMLEISEEQYKALIATVSRKAMSGISNLNQIDSDYYRTEEGLNRFLSASNVEVAKLVLQDSGLIILLNESSNFLNKLKQSK